MLLREIRALGYNGGITQLKEYLRLIRLASEREPVIRIETEPGNQLQLDFVVFRRGKMPLRAFTQSWATRVMPASNLPTTNARKRSLPA